MWRLVKCSGTPIILKIRIRTFISLHVCYHGPPCYFHCHVPVWRSSKQNIRFGNQHCQGIQIYLFWWPTKRRICLFRVKAALKPCNRLPDCLAMDGGTIHQHDENTVMNMEKGSFDYINKNEWWALKTAYWSAWKYPIHYNGKIVLLNKIPAFGWSQHYRVEALYKWKSSAGRKQALYNRTIQNLASAPHFKTRSINEALKENLNKNAIPWWLIGWAFGRWIPIIWIASNCTWAQPTNLESGTNCIYQTTPIISDSISAGRIMDARM